MKKTILFLLFCISSVYAQIEQESILYLKSNIRHTSSDLGYPPISNIQLQTSGIQNNSSAKSGFMAVVYSLILPGMGELYAGNYNRGKYFTIAEGALWGFWAGFNVYGNWQKDNYKSFAASEGGVNPTGKNDIYYAEIGKYIDIDIYNHDKALNRSYDEMYNKENYFWKWEDQDERREYRDIWLSSERAYNNIRFAIGAMIVNRIVSAINAALVVRTHNKMVSGLNEHTLWNFSVGFAQDKINVPEVRFDFQKPF